MLLRSLCLRYQDIQLSLHSYSGESLMDAVQRKTGEKIDEISLWEKKSGFWHEMGMDIVECVGRELAYFVMKRWCEPEWEWRRLIGSGIDVYRSVAGKRNSAVKSYRRLYDLGMLLSEIDHASEAVSMARVRQIWRKKDDEFMIEFQVESDLRQFVQDHHTHSGLGICSIRYFIRSIVEWCKNAREKQWFHYLPYYVEFFRDDEGNMRIIVDKWLDPENNCEKDPFYVWLCGLSLAYIFSQIEDRNEIMEKINLCDVEPVLTGMTEDVAKIIRSCVCLEEDRLTFSSLVQSESLNLGCGVTLSGLTDKEVISASLEVTGKGLLTQRVLELILQSWNTDKDNVFILFDDKVVGDVISDNYAPEYSLSFCVLKSAENFSEKIKLSSGAFGKVFSYKDEHNNIFALKKFKIKCSVFEILNEVNIMKRLSHRRIVSYFECFHERRDIFYIKMEHMESSLGVIVRDSVTGLELGDVKRFTLHIVEGLEYLHSQNIIHRDIKCDNVLVNGTNAKLTDFGLSKVLTVETMNEPKQHSYVGTVYCMAPEIMNENNYDSSIDIWSLGATVWEMASGRYSYSGVCSNQIILEIIKTCSLEKNPDIRAEIQDFINICTMKTPSDRPTAEMLLSNPFLQNVQ